MVTNDKMVRNLIISIILITGSVPVILYMFSFNFASKEIIEISFRESPRYQQWIAVISAFVIKPTYMLLSLCLIILLRKAKNSDLAALRWGLIAFLGGELFCAVNYLFFNEASHMMEYLHSFGMVASFGFIVFSIVEFFDKRIIKYSDINAKCVWFSVCKQCIKVKDVSCGLTRIFKWIVPSLILISLMPLNAVTQFVSYDTYILGSLYRYGHSELYQLFEIRYAPLTAIVFFIVSLFMMPRNHKDGVLISKVFFSVATGCIGFSFFRLILLSFYKENMLWFVFWEEATELLLIVFIAVILWIFREELLGLKVAKIE